MKLESRREREMRYRRQKRASILGAVITFALVLVIGVALLVGKSSIDAKNKEYESQIAKLENQLKEQEERKQDLEEYRKYIQTKKFVEEVAKDKFGLLYPNEIMFKPKED